MRFTLLMEDLETTHRQFRQSEGIDYKTAEKAVVQLARFHAPLANNPEIEKNFEPYSKFFSNIKSFAPNNILCEEFMNRVQTLFVNEMTTLWKAVQQVDFKGTPLEGSTLPQLLAKLDIGKFMDLHKQMLNNMLTFDKA